MTDATRVLASLPLDQLHDSPWQPRTHYANLDGLAESIRADGVLQPLMVRPRLPNKLRDDITDGYEIIFGHRRSRAAELAGLTHVPCVVVTMVDSEVRSAQMAENVQRDNMRAIEEAAGYQAQIDDDGITMAELAKRIGKSPSHVSARLKLLQLTPEVRRSLEAGSIGAEVAVLIARVGPPVVQAKALAAIRSGNLSIDMGDGGRRSLRSVRNLLAEKFTLELTGRLLFDPEDAALVPDAGACSACPKRSGNAPEFADLVALADQKPNAMGRMDDWANRCGPDLCTDPDCFDAKKRAALAVKAQALEAGGQEVITGNKARAALDANGQPKGAYVAASDVKAELGRVNKALAKAGKAAPTPITIQDPRNGKVVTAYRRADLERVGAAPKAPEKPKQTDWEARRREEEAACAAEIGARTRLLRTVRQALHQRPRSRTDLQIVVASLLEEADGHVTSMVCELHDAVNYHALADALDDMSPDQLALLLLDLVLCHHVHVNSRYAIEQSPPSALLAMAEHLGIDVDAARAEPASTPSNAARAAEDAPAVGKVPHGVRYMCPFTLATWSGKGLQPRWLKTALANGKRLADFEVKASAAKDEADKARSAGQEVDDDAADGGERDPNTGDMFEESHA
jgi:ParB/RepB/Spo0J family partition protein